MSFTEFRELSECLRIQFGSTPWIALQGMKYEKKFKAILSCVRLGELSLEEMSEEFQN